MQLQKNLNKLGIKGKNGRLKEDGVYGKETLSAWMAFMKKLETGTVPTLAWVDALKNNSVQLEIGSSFAGTNNTIQDAILMHEVGRGKRQALQNWHYFRIDPPHQAQQGWFRGRRQPIDYNHINIDFQKPPTEFQTWLKKNFNHYPLTDNAYNATKDLKAFGKNVRAPACCATPAWQGRWFLSPRSAESPPDAQPAVWPTPVLRALFRSV